MSLRSLLNRSKRRFERDGAVELTREIYKFALHKTHPYTERTSIFDREWDLLIVIDACRYDLFESVASEYGYIDTVDSIQSVQSNTKEWMRETFLNTDEDLSDIAYICGNPFSREMLQGSGFTRLDEVWEYGWDGELGTLPPRAVTDRTISAGREQSSERIIAHYMQPHCPFVGGNPMQKKTIKDWGNDHTSDIWGLLKRGAVTKEQVWENYRLNLEYVLDEIEVLVNNIETDTAVICSDHGNSLGEWRIYGHPKSMPFSSVRTVPWATVSTTDANQFTPALSRDSDNIDEMQVNDRLKALGYR